VPVAHTGNPSYLGNGSPFETGPGKVYEIHLEKKIITRKRGGGLAQGIGPEFKPQYCKKKKKLCVSYDSLISRAPFSYLSLPRT
jgi:hypothetical protein